MIKPLAIYLPQYHSIPENDKAWGVGFTEWTNVKKAKPLFDGHYQPHIPHDTIGYYDLNDPEIIVRQSLLAKQYGIYGFAFYHYWFDGKRLLEQPLDNMLKSEIYDFPFLYIWANESWSKRWDGKENEIIQEQVYSLIDDKIHIKFLCENVFSHRNYIRIENKPVFIVYRTELLPNVIETSNIWREVAKEYGYDDLYLIRVESFESGVNPADIGFDGVMEFAPDWKSIDKFKTIEIENSNVLVDYESTLVNMLTKQKPSYPYFRGIYPSWDNSARKSNNAKIFVNNSLSLFDYWVKRTIADTEKDIHSTHGIFFINAWNEWGEGCHIEPDIDKSFSYLECFRDLVPNVDLNVHEEYISILEKNIIELTAEHHNYDVYKTAYMKLNQSKGHVFVEKLLKYLRKLRKWF